MRKKIKRIMTFALAGLIIIEVVINHVHSYTETIAKEATCISVGEKLFTCDCGESYSEQIEAIGHSYVDGTCENCDEADSDYASIEAGLYDTNGVMLASWEDSGIDVETDYSSSSSDNNCKTKETSPYYVLTNTYPTATKVVLPNDVTDIGNYAFYYCSNLESIEIPESVTSIGNYAFYYCSSLENIEIPESVTSIGISAFYLCSNLNSITIPNGVTSIERMQFYKCSNLATVTMPEGVKNIGACAFSECKNLSSISIPESVTSIGVSAFSGCKSLSSISIPKSVTSIGKNAFYGCTGLKNIMVDENNTVYDGRDNGNAIIETNTNTLIVGCQNTIIPKSVTSIGAWAFSGCTTLTSITIPESVTSIGESAFCICIGLTNIEIPESVASIGNNAFKQCSSLNDITISEGVTSIGNNAFYGCTGLTNIEIPSSVTNIGACAFSGCSNLTSATFDTTSGWYIGNFVGTKTTAISKWDLVDESTAATYLTTTYYSKYWTR